jgi:hypothetical protein
LLEHVRVRDAKVSSCGGFVAATCLAAKGALPFDVTYVDGFGFGREQARYLFESARFSIDLAKVDDQWDYSCLNLRARAPDGRLSEAVRLCGDEASLFEVDSNDDLSCTPEGLVQDDVLVRDVEQDQRDLPPARKTSSGCNVTRKPHGSSAAVAAQLALLLLLGARSSGRRRRAR